MEHTTVAPRAYAARIALLAALAIAGRARAEEPAPKYLDPKLPIEARLDDLLPRLTLAEKIQTLCDDWGSAAIPRLKIPSMLKTEGLHAQSYGKGATVFPHAIAMAATFDTELVGQIGVQTAIEAKLAGIRQSWSPVLDVARDARWGRIEETYGEDPYLVSRMGVAWINGFQGQGMIATPKHFAIHGQPLGGRDSHDTDLSDRLVREVHLPSFRAAVEEAHVGAIMAAYSTFHGVPCNASVPLLRGILQQEWGFDGIVVSDCGGPEQFITKHNIVATPEEAAQKAIAAGVNMECGSVFRKYLAPAVQEGLIEEAALDEGVRRVLRAKMVLGLFETPPPPRINMEFIEGYDAPARRALAREVAVRSMVLVKNDAKLLPLKKDLGSIAVIGPVADDPQIGDYSPKTLPNQLVSVLAGIKSHVGPNTKVTYAKGCDPIAKTPADFTEAMNAAKTSDTVVLVVGDYKGTTGENNDGATLDLPGQQRELVKAVASAGKPVVLVVVNGKPFTLGWEAEHLPAILVSWYPGEEGGNATADLLFGDRNPSGRLPITFPRSPGQLPLTYDYKPSGRRYEYYDEPFTPQFRFGYGQSYTTFAYSDLKATPNPADPGNVDVTATVKNTGDREGDEVAQLYVTDLQATVSTPVMQLMGFQRLSLKPGESKPVSFHLTPYQLSLLDEGMHRVVEPGRFRVHVGGASPTVPEGTDRHKEHVGFKDAAQGISGAFDVPTEYRARFECKLDAPTSHNGGETFPATVTLKNSGNLTDVTEVALWGDGRKLDAWQFEVNPGETKTHTFNVALYGAGPNTLAAVTSTGMTAQQVNVAKAPAKLAFGRVRTKVDASGHLVIVTRATNVGSSDLAEDLKLSVDGTAVVAEPVKLAPGEQRDVALAYALPRSGSYKVQFGEAPVQQVAAPGAVTLSLRQPQVLLSFPAGQDAAINAVTGKPLRIEGKPAWMDAPGGRAMQTASADTLVTAESIDLYRKPFTLAARVNIFSLGQRDSIALFGGQAPMGADQDQNGTLLHVGVQEKKLKMSFFGATVTGNAAVPTGQWVHVAYTYDPKTELGAVYLNGKLDRRQAMKPYTGPLETIGTSKLFAHGNYAFSDVIVLRTCLSDGAVAELAKSGVEALKHGTATTDWRDADASKITAIDISAAVPAGGHATTVIESGDGKAVLDSTTVELQDGRKSYPIKPLKPGTHVRVRLMLSVDGRGDAPGVSAVALAGGATPIQWSFADDWSKAELSPGVRVETDAATP